MQQSLINFMKSWDLQACDRASTTTHVDREKKNSANCSNDIFYFSFGKLLHSDIFETYFQIPRNYMAFFQDSYIYYKYFCKFEKHASWVVLRLGALLTQTWEDLHRAGALDVLYILQTSMHAWHFENIVRLRPKIVDVWYTGVLECTSVHGIAIVVLNKLMKFAGKTQSLLASTPCLHKSHVIALVTVHDFIFQLSMASLTNCKVLWRWQHVQPLRVHAIQNTRATTVARSQQQAVKK